MAKGKYFPIVVGHHLTGVKPTEKLVFTTLCWFANNETNIAFPSVETIAERSCIKPRQTQKILRSLEKIGLIMRVKNSLGGRNKETTHYKMNLTHPLISKTKVIRDASHNTPTGVLMESKPCTLIADTPVIAHTQTNDELYITKTVDELNNEYGKKWKWDFETTMKVVNDLNIKIRPEGEPAGDLVDRIIEYCNKGAHGI
jgi:hypothetical protein